MSGATQSQLISALRYLELITDKDLPTERLRQIHGANTDQRKALLREMVTSAYPFLFDPGFDLRATTWQHLEEQFREKTGASGATIDRCISFFKPMAEEAGIELSPHLDKPRARRSRSSQNGSSRRAKIKPEPASAEKREDDANQQRDQQRKRAGGNSRTVDLRSGAGQITLTYTVDLFELDENDQRFVLDLVGRMKRYEDDSDTGTRQDSAVE